MTRGDEIDYTFNKDPKLKDDTELDIDGKSSITYGELKERYPIRMQEPIKCLVYWDDVCQYTSIGLIEVVNALCGANAKIDLEHFFTRPNEYIYGIKYVYKLFEGSVSKKDIDAIKKKYYWKILEISLKSTVFNSLLQTNSFYQKLGFYFPYKFDHCNELQAGFKDIFFKNKPFDSLKFYYGSDDKKSFNQIMKEDGYNSVITPNLISVYEYILDNKMKRITLIGPEDHNGFTEDIYKVFDKYNGLPMPNYCALNLYEEQIMAPNE